MSKGTIAWAAEMIRQAESVGSRNTPLPTEYIYRDHWIALIDTNWHVMIERHNPDSTTMKSQCIDACMAAIDEVLEDM